MASRGIKDRVAIIGIDAPISASIGTKVPKTCSSTRPTRPRSAGVEPNNVDAYWLGTMASGVSA